MELNPQTLNIGIVYKQYIPAEWFDEFEISLKDYHANVGKKQENPRIENYTGPDLTDILIYIKDSPESIFLAPAVYDIFKSFIILFWEKLISTPIKRISSNKTEDRIIRKISIKYEDSYHRRIDINIEGEFNKKYSKQFIKDAIKVLKEENSNVLFKQNNLVDNKGKKKRIEINYDKNLNSWEPVDFEKKQQELDEGLKSALRDLKH